jgi:hypothetical protein
METVVANNENAGVMGLFSQQSWHMATLHPRCDYIGIF